MSTTAIILAPHGFPWRSLIIWVVAFAVVWAIGVFGFGGKALGGSTLVAAILANGAFAAALSPR